MGRFSEKVLAVWVSSWREVLVALCVFAQIIVIVHLFKAYHPGAVPKFDDSLGFVNGNPGTAEEGELTPEGLGVIAQRLLHQQKLQGLGVPTRFFGQGSADPYLSQYIADAAGRLRGSIGAPAKKSAQGKVLTRGVMGLAETDEAEQEIGRSLIKEAALLRLRGLALEGEGVDGGVVKEDDALRSILQSQLAKSDVVKLAAALQLAESKGAGTVGGSTEEAAATEEDKSGDQISGSQISGHQKSAEVSLEKEQPFFTPGDNGASSCDGRRVFVYEYLPSRFHDELITNCSNSCDNSCDNMCPTLEKDGLGSPLDRPENETLAAAFIDAYDGHKYTFGPWLGTQQNLVGVLFRARMQSYSCLTTDWQQADAFYIPALFGLKTMYGSHLPFHEIEQLGDELETFLAYQPGFLRKGGKDHFFVVGQQYTDFMCRERNAADKDWSWCSYLYYRPVFNNVTLVSVERPHWEQRIQSIPYLTAFHPTTVKEVNEWMEHVRNHPRPHMVTLLAGRRSNVPVRQAVLDACEAHHDKCTFVDCSGECPRGSCRKVVGYCGEPRLVAREYLSSVFCLMPNGDSATRRSIFDALIAGCIPVHFDASSFDLQYPWHKNGLSPHNVSVLFDSETTRNGTLDFLTELHSIPRDTLQEMQRRVIELIPGLIFRDHTLGGPEAYPLKDAFDLAIEGILQHLVTPVTYST